MVETILDRSSDCYTFRPQRSSSVTSMVSDYFLCKSALTAVLYIDMAHPKQSGMYVIRITLQDARSYLGLLCFEMMECSKLSLLKLLDLSFLCCSYQKVALLSMFC